MWGCRACQPPPCGACQLQPGLPHSTIPPPCWVRQPPPCRESSPPRLPISAPSTGLDECFFFISLVVGLPYSSIFCQFWLFFVFKLLLSFFWLCEEAQCVYLRLHLGRNSEDIWYFHQTCLKAFTAFKFCNEAFSNPGNDFGLYQWALSMPQRFFSLSQ